MRVLIDVIRSVSQLCMECTKTWVLSKMIFKFSLKLAILYKGRIQIGLRTREPYKSCWLDNYL